MHLISKPFELGVGLLAFYGWALAFTDLPSSAPHVTPEASRSHYIPGCTIRNDASPPSECRNCEDLGGDKRNAGASAMYLSG